MKTNLRTFTLIITLITLFVSSASADDAILNNFVGGRMEMNLSAASQLLSGPGISSATTASVTATRSDPFAVFSNPSSWMIVRDGAAVGVSIQPRLAINSVPGGIQNSVNESVDQAISGYSQSNSVDYPELAGSLGRTTNPLASVAVIVPVKDWRFGAGYSKPFSLDLSAVHDGFTQSVTQASDNPAESISLDLASQMDMSMNAESHRFLLGAAREYGRWSFGLSASRTSLELNVNGGYTVDGDVSVGGDSYSFNSGADSWHNDFGGAINGSYKGAFYNSQLGATLQLGSNPETAWTLAASASINIGGNLKGSMEATIDEYLPLSLNDNEASFDIDRVDDINQVTRTYENTYYMGDELTVELPSSFSIGIGKPNGLRPNLTLTAYTGNLAYSLDVTEKRVQDTEYSTNTYVRGITPKASAYLGFSPGVFFLGAGMTYAEDLVAGYTDDGGAELSGGTEVYIPRFDLGMILPLSNHLRAEVMFVGLPEDALRMGLIWEF